MTHLLTNPAQPFSADIALKLLESILNKTSLSNIQAIVFQEAWQGCSYQKIADQHSYEYDYIKQVGSQLWQLLSQELGEKVSKKNIYSVLRRYQQSQPKLEHNEQFSSISKFKNCILDWGEAPTAANFFERKSEIITLEKWMIKDNCSLVAILGIGGIGKTALSVRLVGQIQDRFECVIWRSLRHAPPFQELIPELILCLSHHQDVDIPQEPAQQISRLIDYLKQHRCLLVLDNVESILCAGNRAGRYRTGFENYGSLLEQVADTSHQSCVLLTSREKPAGISVREGNALPIRSMTLPGLSATAGQAILSTKGLETAKHNCDQLIERYCGNPLALKIAASTASALFGGDLTEFLNQGVIVFGDIWDLFEQQFQRLTDLEKQVMRWLATNREWTTLAELREDIVPTVSHRVLLEAVESLQARFLIETSAHGFTQQPVVMEFMTERLVDQFYQELQTQNIDQLKQHVLIKAQTKDYIREIQIRLVLEPVIRRLQTESTSQEEVELLLKQILNQLRGQDADDVGYACGNILNTLQHLKVDFSGYNLSGQTLRQAYLADANLSRVDFSQANIDQSVFASTFGSILSVAFSPDDQLLVMGDAKGDLSLFQGRLREPKAILRGHTSMIWSVAFSPCSQTIASASNDGTIKLWCSNTGTCFKTLIDHHIGVLCVAFSRDGKQLVSGGNNGQVKIWNVHTGDCLQTLPADLDQIWSVTFSPVEDLLVTGGSDGVVKLWDLVIGQCFQTLKGHTGCIYSLNFSPDGQILASGSGDQTIKLWDAHEYDCYHTLTGHKHQVSKVKWTAHDQTLVSCSHDHTMRLWNTKTGKCLYTLKGHKNWVSDISLSTDGRTLISCSEDQMVKYWDIETRKCLKTLQGQGNQVWSLAFSPDGHMLASGDENLRLWDLQTGEHLTCLRGHSSRIMSVKFSPNGRLLASSSRDGTTKIWDVQSVRCIQTLIGASIVRGAIFSPDSHFLVNVHFDNSISLWNLRTNQCCKEFYGHKGWTLNAKFHPDGGLLASGSMDRTIKFWDVRTGQCLNTVEDHRSWVVDLDFSHTGDLLASGSDDQTVKLWDTQTGDCLKTYEGHLNTVTAVMFHPDSDLLVSASHDKTIKVWNTHSGECLKTLEGHEDAIWSAAFSPDGKLIASGGQDCTIRLWDVKTGECLHILESPRPYEGMNITKVNGLTDAQKMTLKNLGAFEEVLAIS